MPGRMAIPVNLTAADDALRGMSSSAAVLPPSVRVSVVVPVFNPGPSFDDLIASLERQSLDASQFEVLLCDDGSDEPTQRRLEQVAAAHPNVRVLALPHSGWPGTPRNEGVAAARGDYVQFVDQDDYLFDDALEQLADYADANGSDVVVGREVGIGRPLPSRIFRHDIPDAKLGEDPLLEMLTPHKLFRTAFLRENGIRFPDGRVRLEDHLYVMQAYFAARTISILASVPCYAWVKHPGSASSSRIDPESYFPHLEAVLDIVEAHTEPGRMRDRLLRHWLRGKILKRLSGKRMLRYPAEYRTRLLDVVTPLVEARFGPGVDAGLAFPQRIRVALLRAGRRDDLVRFAEFEAGLKAQVSVSSAEWSRGGGLHLTIEAAVTRDGRKALAFDAETGSLTSLPLESLEELPTGALVAGRELRNDRIEVFLVGEKPGTERRIVNQKLRDGGTIRVSIDPLKVFGGDGAPAALRLRAKVRRAGWTFDVPVTADAAVLARTGASPLLAGSAVTLTAVEGGAVEVRRSGADRLRDLAGRSVRRVRQLARR